MHILDRYLTGRVLTRFLLVAGVLSAVFSGYTLALYLSRAAAGFLKPEFIVEIVLMKTVIASEIVLPLSLYAAVLFAFDHLRRTHETTAMQAVGFGPRQAATALMPLFILIATLVGLLSVWGRPAAYAALYDVRTRAEMAFEIVDVEPGRFYVDSEGVRVVFVDERDEATGDMRGVFIWTRRPDGTELLVRAKGLSPRGDDEAGRPSVQTDDLRIWETDENGCTFIGGAGSLVTSVDFGDVTPRLMSRKARPTRDLMDSDDPEDRAEFQWRVSRPLSALLLGLLAVFIGGWARLPRRRIIAVPFWIGSCTAYYFLAITARSWVRDGIVGDWPGLWWVDALLAVLLGFVFLRAMVTAAWIRWRLGR